MASEAGVDLVELVPDAEPPVCRLMNYGKFRFEQKKKLHDQRKKQRQVQIKEIKFYIVCNLIFIFNNKKIK